MGALTIPTKARPVIALTVGLLMVALYILSCHSRASILLAILAVFISGFVADAFTGLAHFGFDYVFSHQMPVLGPIASEFNEHHAEPTLDPSSYVENFTKGAYASLPVVAGVLLLLACAPEGPLWFLAEAVFMGIAVWAFFFHQIHAYAHMGSSLSPEVFNARVDEISRLQSKCAQRRALGQLFETVPIPPAIRLLQRCGLILSPERHNLHHVCFERDFSSVNGWSDPFLNPFLGPVARRYKARRGAARSDGAALESGPRPTYATERPPVTVRASAAG
jgi:hypothetical protein